MAQERKKALDIFNETSFVFAEKKGFDEIFPQIEDLRVEVEQTGSEVNEWERNKVYTKQNFPGEFINCRNSMCCNGGFSIGAILHEMLSKKEREKQTSMGCRGYDGSPSGKSIYQECLNAFEIKVSIKYKATEEND